MKILIGLSGEIVDETKNTIKIKTIQGIKTIIKSIVIINIELSDKTKIQVEGRNISYRSEDRIGRMGKKH